MSIDESSLSNGEVYTFLSNKDAHCKKGAIAAYVKGTKIEDIVTAVMRIPEEKRTMVEEVTMDFSESMRASIESCFPNARRVVDRFHVQQEVNAGLNEIRMIAKRKERKLDLKARKKHQTKLRQRLKRRKKDKTAPRGRKPKRLNEAYIPEKLSNGETPTEALTRCRYSLNRSGNYWTETQVERNAILFKRHPDVEKAYSLSHSIRMIFSNPRATVISGIESMEEWYKKVEEWNNPIFNAIADTIKSREDEILNYFINRATNAGAESLNSKIKQFRAQLRGISDVKFFLFRLTKLFA